MRAGLGLWLSLGAVIAALAGCSPKERAFPGEGGSGAAGGAGGAGTGGSGGAPAQDFSFAIVPIAVNVPYEGINLIEVQVTRSGGFDAPVEITADTPPPGLTVEPLTVPAGASSAEVQVSASGVLMLGTTFTLRLAATSGDLARQAEVPATVTGKPGTLDPTFAGTGVYGSPHSTDGGTLLDLLVFGDGVIAGSGDASNNGGNHFFATRLLSDGTPDVTFGTSGKQITNLCSCSGDSTQARALGRQLSGKIVSAGPREYQGDASIALVRYRETGTLDSPYFGDGTGKLIQDLGGAEEAWDLAVAPDDRIVVVGAKDGAPLALRFTPDGALDTTFASPNGWVTVPYPGALRAVTLDPDGNILTAGSASVSSPSEIDAVIGRLTPAGAFDSSFGGGMGAVVLNMPGTAEVAIGVAVLPDGNIIAAGHTSTPNGNDLIAWRLRPDGTPDTNFGDNGRAVIPLDGDEQAADMQVLPDGRVMILANATGGSAPGPLLVRLRASGAPDPTLGEGGVARPYVGQNAHLYAMDLLPGSKLLVAGDIEEGYPYPGVVARLWN